MNMREVLLLGAISLPLAGHWGQPISVPTTGLWACGSECFPDLPFELFVDRWVIWPKFQEMCFGLCTREEGH